MDEVAEHRQIVWGLAAVDGTENVAELALGPLMSIYVPVIGADNTLLGVYEVHLRWAPLEARLLRLRLIVEAIVFVAFSGLYLALLGTFRSASRAIVHQKEQAEDLASHLQEAKTGLEEALSAKDVMVQNVSHELRTPLTHIIGYKDILLDGM